MVLGDLQDGQVTVLHKGSDDDVGDSVAAGSADERLVHHHF
jgi:hypothetical protein